MVAHKFWHWLAGWPRIDSSGNDVEQVQRVYEVPALTQIYQNKKVPLCQEEQRLSIVTKQRGAAHLVLARQSLKAIAASACAQRIIVPFDERFEQMFPDMVKSVFTGAVYAELVGMNYEVVTMAWKNETVAHAPRVHRSWQGVDVLGGATPCLRSQDGDCIVLLQGTGMQQHLGCVLAYASPRKLVVATNATQPALMKCNACDCLRISSQKQ